MHRRPASLAAFATVLALGSGATAAPRSCRLVTDPKGDDVGTGWNAPPVTDGVADDGDLDVLSADVATNATFVTAVIRTAKMRGPNSPDSPLGRSWELWFLVAEQRYILHATAAPDGYDGIVYRLTFDDTSDRSRPGAYAGEGIGRARVTFDGKRAEVSITAPLSHFAEWTPITKDRTLRDLRVLTYKHYGVGGGSYELTDDLGAYYGSGGLGHSVDQAFSKKTYRVGSPSCVAVGR